jgi:hypothetical protein
VRAGLQAGGTTEIAGYEIAGKLVSEIERIVDPFAEVTHWQGLSWFDVVAAGISEPGAAARRQLDLLRGRRVNVNFEAVPGEPFWATPEIAVVPRLVDATVAALAGPVA